MPFWRAVLTSLVVVLAGVLGCQKQCFLSERDFDEAHAIGLPKHLECDASLSIIPPAGIVPPPMTVDDTKRPERYLSLREAIAIALENGTVGLQNASTPGLAVDTLGGFAGTTVQSADAIRVLALDPAISASNIELSLSKFDTLWNTSLTWNRTETPLGISPTTFVQTGAFLPNVSADNLTFNTGLEKPLPTGGVAGITFGLSSQWNTPASPINPAIQPSLQFVFEQPLLKGFGVEINQLLEAHPDSKLFPFTAVTPVLEGILITRIRFDQQRSEFERNVNFLLLNVEAAYWNLYGAYHQLYAREEGMRFSYEAWRVTKEQFDSGRTNEQSMDQDRVQYEQFRSQRMTALAQVLESERQLRSLLGLKIEDGYRLVPTDSPLLTPYVPDWKSSLDETLARRPELTLARQDLRFRQLDLIRLRNDLLPDLRFLASDTLHSVGSHLDEGSSPDNAFHKLFSDPFNNFSLGFLLNVPLGFRAANAQVRAAELNLQRSYLSLRTEEDKAERFLGLAYRQVFEFQRQIQINQAVLRAATNQLERNIELFRQGRAIPSGADLILAEQNWSNAVVSFYNAIVQYNNALATLEFAKGSVMQRDNVFISDGPLPLCAQVRAVEHERQRTAALVLHERSACNQPGISCQQSGVRNQKLADPTPKVPHVPVDKAVSLPALFEGRPPVGELSDSQVTATSTAQNSLTSPSDLQQHR